MTSWSREAGHEGHGPCYPCFQVWNSLLFVLQRSSAVTNSTKALASLIRGRCWGEEGLQASFGAPLRPHLCQLVQAPLIPLPANAQFPANLLPGTTTLAGIYYQGVAKITSA